MKNKIKIYTTQWCSFCKTAKAFLQMNNAEFEEFDIEMDHGRAHEMVEKSHQTGVPVIDIDGQIIVGFNKERIEELLNSVKNNA